MGSTLIGSLWGTQAGFCEVTVEPVTFPVTVTQGIESIELDWDAVDGAQFYRVFCGLASDKMTQVSEDLINPGYTINNLLANQQYFTQVTAVLTPRESIASVTDDGTGTGTMVAMQLLGLIPEAPELPEISFNIATDPSICHFNNLQQSGSNSIQVNLSEVPEETVTVDYATSDGPAWDNCGSLPAAVAGTDYDSTSGTLTWESGDDTPKSFNVTTIQGGHPRAFSITLSNAVGATINGPVQYEQIPGAS